MVDLMNEEFFTYIYKLAMNNPGIQLMIKDSMAAKKYLREHIFYNWITACAFLVKSIEYLASTLALLFNLKHKIQQSWEHLEIDSKLLLQ